MATMNDVPKQFGPEAAGPQNPNERWGRRFVLLATLALVLVPSLWALVPAEIARWHQSASMEAELRRDFEAAVEHTDHALRWCPMKAPLYGYRAGLNLELKKFDEALQDVKKCLEIDPDSSYAVFQRMLISQRIDDHETSLADADTLVNRISESPIISREFRVGIPFDGVLNLRAYARALANQEIEEGLADVENAIERAGVEIPAYLDTRGYLRYLNGEFDDGLRDMERAVELAEDNWAELKKQTDRKDTLEWMDRDRVQQEELAVLYQHRGLIYQAIGLDKEAAEDFRRATEYGYSPEDGIW